MVATAMAFASVTVSLAQGTPDSPAPPSSAAPTQTDKEILDNPIYKAGPKYPQAAFDAKIEGTVVLEVVIGLDGNVTTARVVKATPSGWFEEAALAAVKAWKYKPAGREITFQVVLEFKLHDTES